MAVAMKYERQGFLNTGTIAAKVWTRMGEGFKDLTDARNPIVDEARYIHDSSSTKSITGYAPEWAMDFDVIKENTVIDFIRSIGENSLIREDAETEYLEFDLWDLVGSSVACVKYSVAVKVDSIGGGTGGEKLTGSGALLGKGAPVFGTFDIDTLVFTDSVS